MVNERNAAEPSSEGDEEYLDPPEPSDRCDCITMQYGQGENSRVVTTNMDMDFLFIITLVMRICLRYGDVCIIDLIEFFNELDWEAISSDQLESHIQTLFQNDDTNMERLWNELGIESFLPDVRES